MNPLSSFYSMTPTIPTPPPTLFWALTLLTTTTYITTLASKTLTGSATAWLRPFLRTRRRRNIALAFYVAIVLLEFLQSEWIMAGDWGIVSGLKAFASWVASRGDQSPGWVEWLGPLAGLAGRLFVICNTGSMVFLWLGMAVKELVSLDVDRDGGARKVASKKEAERKE
ncbi:hypothetical protein BJX62DRAFT_195793 [Aspergillus germanicus]